MLQIISEKAIENQKFDKDSILGYSAAGGVVMSGFLTGHIAAKLFKKTDSLLVNGGMAVGALAGAVYIKHPLAKLALLGVAVYGGTRCLAIGVQEVTTPGDVKGLAGFIPESLKTKMREFIPTLGDINQNLLGLGNISGEDDLGEINLDDAISGTEDVPYEDVSNQRTIGSPAMMMV